jgi:hypothetical protein
LIVELRRQWSIEIHDPVTDARMAHHSDSDSDTQEGCRHLVEHNIPAIMIQPANIYIVMAYNTIDQSLVYSNVPDNK